MLSCAAVIERRAFVSMVSPSMKGAVSSWVRAILLFLEGVTGEVDRSTYHSFSSLHNVFSYAHKKNIFCCSSPISP